jgi:DNA-binding winged helix-turn-helix (wHTH) protein
MTDARTAQPAGKYRFGIFEADATVGELRKKGIRIKINAQPLQVLFMFLERPGELLTREEISRELWPDGTFVDYEHGVNSAVNRIREALGDRAANPRFVETLARRGYRFVAPVERIDVRESPSPAPSEPVVHATQSGVRETPQESIAGTQILASAEELPKAPRKVVRTLLLLLQLMYLGFYVGALANLAEIEDLLSTFRPATEAFIFLVVTAAVLIPVRAFLVSGLLFHAPGLRGKFLKLWRFLLPLDLLWSLAPFLLLHHINIGVAISCTALLVYSPFAQRSLVLMGACDLND